MRAGAVSRDECIRIDYRKASDEAVVMLNFLAVLIYPGSTRKRAKFIDAALAYGVRVCRHHNMRQPTWAPIVVQRVKQQQQQNQLQQADRILERRLAAGRALQAILLSHGRMTLREAARRSRRNSSHFIHAAWAQSKPVLHLALSLLTTTQWPMIRKPDGSMWRDSRPRLLSLIARCDWAIEASRQSEAKLVFIERLAQLRPDVAVFSRLPRSGRVRIQVNC